MLEYLQTHMAETTIVIGLVLLVIEAWLLGLSTIVLLAIGLSAIVTGSLAYFGIITTDIATLASGTGIGAGALTVLLWFPLKRLQNRPRRELNIHSDFIGLKFVLEQDLPKRGRAYVMYSGIRWELLLSHECTRDIVSAGETVIVKGVEVGSFTVMPQETSSQDSAT